MSPCCPSASIKKTGRPLNPSLELLFHYGIAASLVIPAAKGIAFLPGRLLHSAIPVESSYYTLAALAAAWLLPRLVSLLQNISVKVEFKRYEDADGTKPETRHGE